MHSRAYVETLLGVGINETTFLLTLQLYIVILVSYVVIKGGQTKYGHIGLCRTAFNLRKKKNEKKEEKENLDR